MTDRVTLIASAASAAEDILAARPPQRATTTGHVIAAALPTIVHNVLDDVRRCAVRSMTPAQIRAMCDELEARYQKGNTP